MLVDYSDSESESESEERFSNDLETCKAGIIANYGKHNVEKAGGRPTAQDSPPPLPASFRSLYATNARNSVVDDPKLHGGRTRQVPHVEGNWQTHIYLEWSPNAVELENLTDVLSQLQKPLVSDRSKRKVYDLLRSDLGAPLPLHISLSAPLILKTDQRNGFYDIYESALAHSNIKNFVVCPIALDWVRNYDHTRFFLVLRLSKPDGDELNKLLALSNECVEAFGLNPLYEASNRASTLQKSRTVEKNFDYSSTFHISIAWSLEEPSNLERKAVEQIDLGKLKAIRIRFDRVHLKVGNAIQAITFSKG